MKEFLSADSPLTNPKDDGLGVAPFAENAAKAISNIEIDECLVFALYGPWGSGKTTCMNFIRYYINQQQDRKPLVMEFNPWWFSGSGELLRQFLGEFLSTLGKHDKYKKVTQSVGNLLGAISIIPYAKTASGLIKQFTKEKPIINIKENIKRILKENNGRFLIIIDDIDRLTPEEIRILFCVIKAVADFPRTSYILAFDKNVIIDALDHQNGKNGKDYLEKIVQVPFDLPIPEKVRINKIFTEKLNVILSDTDSAMFDPAYWGNVFFGGIDHFIDTLRKVNQLTNAIIVSYAAVKGEVNPIDFVAIETLRVFCSEIYYLIRSNPEMFVGHSELPFFDETNKKKIKAFHDDWLKNIPEEEKEILADFLMRIFPRLEAVFKDHHYAAEFLLEWRKQLRICSPDRFQIYFRFSLPEGKISNDEMKTILDLTGDVEAFSEKLIYFSHQKRPYDDSTKVSEVLERLLDYAKKDIPYEHIGSVIKVIFKVGDKLLLKEDEGKGLWGFGNDMRMGQIFFELLRRLKNQGERYEILKEAISEGNAISMIVSEVETLGQQHGKYDSSKRAEDEWFINSQQLAELEKIALKKIKESASKGKLIKISRAIQIFHRWRDWGNVDEVKKYIAEVISSDEGLVDYLSLYLSQVSSLGMDDKVPSYQWRLDPRSIEPWVEDISEVGNRCKKVLDKKPKWLNEKRQTAVETFISSFALILKGKDIDADLDKE